jgi:hypothetical protein
MQFMKPRFRFGLFLVDQGNKPYFQKNVSQNQNQPGQPVTCHADSYEINADGSIVFYQTGKSNDDKRFKIPVLAYPHGKWEACVLLDSNNQIPVFSGQGYINENINMSSPMSTSSRQSVTEDSSAPWDNNSNNSNNSSSTSSASEMDDLDEMLGEGSGNSNSNFNSSQDNSNNFSMPSQTSGSFSMPGTGGGNMGGNNISMPGISQMNNPQEFKRLKNELIEKHLKDYSKAKDKFDVDEFISYMNKEANGKTFKITDIDVIWVASTLIRSRQVLGRKFSDPVTQKTLGLILPDIMRRQWNGKMNPILEVLQEREETKNVNAIDLAVWMAQNNF